MCCNYQLTYFEIVRTYTHGALDRTGFPYFPNTTSESDTSELKLNLTNKARVGLLGCLASSSSAFFMCSASFGNCSFWLRDFKKPCFSPAGVVGRWKGAATAQAVRSKTCR